MKQFSIEKKPLIGSSDSSYYILPQLSIAWIMLGLGLSISYIPLGLQFFVSVGIRFAIIIAFFFLMMTVPVLHWTVFSAIYPQIPVHFDMHLMLSLLAVLNQAITTMYGCGPYCVVFNAFFCLFLVVNILMLTSICTYYYERITVFSLVEETQLLKLDEKREKIHSTFATNIDELKFVKEKFEHIVHADAAIYVAGLLMSTFVDIKEGSIGGAIIIALSLTFIAYRNLFFVCQWNSLLCRLELSNSLTFEALKIRCFGATLTYEMLIGSLVAVAGLLFKDTIAAL